MDHHFLAQLPLFDKLPQDELERLASTMRRLDLAPDEVLFREGDCGEHFYIVLKGQLEVFRALGTEEERLLARHGVGEFVGELSMMNPDRLRTASVRAKGPVRLWEMSRTDFEGLVRRQPGFVYELMRELGARLTATNNATIEDLKEKNRQLTEAYEALKAAQAQLIEKERLERELQVAHEIQMSVLPQTLPELPGFDFGAQMVPARAVGGDFYDVVRLDGDKMAIIVGDVTDKGVPAALFMTQIHALLHAGADAKCTPREVLERVNGQLMAMGEASLFATVLYGILDGETGEFHYARAGHEPPILVHARKPASLLPWDLGQPLALWEDPAIDEQTVTIPPGATLLVYTDGITDGKSPDGERFEQDRLVASMDTLTEIHAQEVCDRLWQGLVDFQGDAPQADDVTLVAVRRQTA